jgi:hypothetical protein
MPTTICLHCSEPTTDHDSQCHSCGHYPATYDCDCPACSVRIETPLAFATEWQQARPIARSSRGSPMHVALR